MFRRNQGTITIATSHGRKTMRVKSHRRFVSTGIIGTVLVSALLVSHAHAAGLKKVVAVSNFENKSSYGGGGQWNLGTGMSDQLTDALIQSGQFTVLERETLGDVMAEQDLAASGRMQKSNSARTGKLTSAQILIKGAVTEFDLQSSGSGGGIGIKGFRLGSSKEEAHVGLIIRLIDTTTAEVLDSKRVEGKATAGGLSIGVDVGDFDFGSDSFAKTPLGKATQITIDNAVKYIADKLKDLPFQGRVIKASSPDDIYISAGETVNAREGDEFTVYSKGEELIDPDTGELLGVEEEKVGAVKIHTVKEKYSKAKATSGGDKIKRGDIIRSK
jgi:curli biogenesis system outer membrane secretion channel CsgG